MRCLILSSLASAVLLAPAALGQDDKDAGVILTKGIAAHGGEEALARHCGVRMKVRRTEEPTRQSYDHEWLFDAPNRFKDTGDGFYLGRRIVTIYATDGKTAWSVIEGRT